MEAEQQLQRLGIDEILVYCVNDGAVMKGWQESFKLEDDDYVKLFGDPAGSFTRQLGLEMDSHPGPVGVGIIGRSKTLPIHVHLVCHADVTLPHRASSLKLLQQVEAFRHLR